MPSTGAIGGSDASSTTMNGGHAGTAGDDVADGPRVDAERGHDHGDGGGGVRGVLGPGMDRPGVEEPVDELRRRDVLAGGDLFEGPDARRA